MFISNKSFLVSLLMIVLFLLPIFNVAANDVPQQIKQLQTLLIEADEKIMLLAVDQLRTDKIISNLQISLNTAHQEISHLNNSGEYQLNQLTVSSTVHRTANGHGRGGR